MNEQVLRDIERELRNIGSLLEKLLEREKQRRPLGWRDIPPYKEEENIDGSSDRNTT